MSNNYGLNKYKTTSVTTASRGQVLLMLYEGCIKFCKQAIEATKKKDLAEKGKYILKVQDIVNELSVTLDHNIGGNVSRELERLYNYMIDQLTQANIKNDHKPLETVLKLLETLYSGLGLGRRSGGPLRRRSSCRRHRERRGQSAAGRPEHDETRRTLNMEELLGLLERKNLCFRSFNKLCLEFVGRDRAEATPRRSTTSSANGKA